MLASLFLTGCAPFDIHRADADVRFVCDTPAWDALVEDCRAAKCPGVACLDGSGDGQPFVVSGPLDSAVLRLTTLGGAPLIDRLDAFGTGPYFTFAVVAKSVGQPLGSVEPRHLSFAFGAEELERESDDDIVALKVRLSIPGRELNLEASPDVGGLTVLGAERSETELRFEGLFDGEPIQGCIATVEAEVRDR